MSMRDDTENYLSHLMPREAPARQLHEMVLQELLPLADKQNYQYLIGYLNESIEQGTLQNQLFFLATVPLILPECTIRLTVTQLSQMFSRSAGTIWRHIERASQAIALEAPRPTGRPPLLTESQKKLLFDEIQLAFFKKEYYTYEGLADFLGDHAGVFISPESLGSIIRRDPRFKVVLADVMEDVREEASTEEILQYFEKLKRDIDGTPAALILNLDEMGFQEFSDTRGYHVIVPADVEEKDILLPVKRGSNRITIVECIFGDGSRLKPAVIVPRKTVETEVFNYGFTPDNCTIYYQEHGFMVGDIFEHYANTILFPELKKRLDRYRALLQQNLKAHILMDGLQQHFVEYVDEAAFEVGALLHQIPAHSSDQVQALDLGIFAVSKTCGLRMRRMKHINEQSHNIMKVLTMMQKASTPVNIVNAFRRAGIFSSWNPEKQILVSHVDIRFCKKIRHVHFDEVLDSDPVFQGFKDRLNVTKQEYLHVDFFTAEAHPTENPAELEILPEELVGDEEFHNYTREMIQELFPEGTDDLCGKFKPRARESLPDEIIEMTEELSLGYDEVTNIGNEIATEKEKEFEDLKAELESKYIEHFSQFKKDLEIQYQKKLERAESIMVEQFEKEMETRHSANQKTLANRFVQSLEECFRQREQGIEEAVPTLEATSGPSPGRPSWMEFEEQHSLNHMAGNLVL